MKNRMLKTALSLLLIVCMLPIPLAFAEEEKQTALEEGEFSTLDEAVEAGAVSAVPDDTQAYADNEILVVLAGADSETRELAAVEESLSTLSDEDVVVDLLSPELEGGSVALVELPTEVSVEDALLQAANDENIVFAQPNFYYTLLDDETLEDVPAFESLYTPNDPNAQNGSSYRWQLENVHAFEAWNQQKTEGAVTIAIVDSGARMTHQDLGANMLTSLAYDAVQKRECPLSTSVANGTIPYNGDQTGHGTHVAGIAAATAGNGLGGAGVSFNAKILPIVVVGSTGGSSSEALLRAYAYVMANRAVANIRVINLSLGGYTPAQDDLLRQAIIDAKAAGILTVCAAGNKGNDPNFSTTGTITGDTQYIYPGDYDEVVSVVAVDDRNNHAAFSDHNAYKDLAAPGVNIYSTGYISDNSYRSDSGTSMAAPYVSGIAALIFAKDPTLSPDQVRNILYASATDLGTPGVDPYYGHGLVNAEAALTVASQDFNNSIVTITSALNTSRCFDIPGESSANAVQVALWTLEQRPNQRFRFTKDSDGYYTITNIKSQLALDVSGGVAKNSASVVQYTPTGRANQKWKLISNANGSYTMVSKLNENYCLDLSGGGSANGTKLIVYEKGSNKSNQQFSVNKIAAVIANGSYTIQSESSGRFLDIEGVSYNNNARAISWTGNNGLNQRFIFTYNTQTGYYRILSVNSNKPLDVYSASKNEGAAVVQYDANGAYNQQWALVATSGGSYYFYAAHSGKVLDLKGAATTDGTPIIVWSLNGGNNQRWVLTAV